MESRATAPDGQGAGPGLHPSSSEHGEPGTKSKQTPGPRGGAGTRPSPGYQQEVAPPTSPGLPGGAHADVRCRGADAPGGIDPRAPADSHPSPEPTGSRGPSSGPRPPPPSSPPPPSCSPDPSITAAAFRRVRPGRLQRAPVT